jgi:hypothetical protein
VDSKQDAAKGGQEGDFKEGPRNADLTICGAFSLAALSEYLSNVSTTSTIEPLSRFGDADGWGSEAAKYSTSVVGNATFGCHLTLSRNDS